VLQREGHEILDVGTHSVDPVDYPDYAAAVGRTIVEGRANRGVLICGNAPTPLAEAGSDSLLVHWEGNNNLHRTRNASRL
jgi:hypothetical protein